ncbi:MAG: CinA family protein [Pseudomonadales bacterium]
MTDSDPLVAQIADLAQRLSKAELRLATAESCTGGLLAAAMTSVPGASDWYEGGFVTYRLSAKSRMLDIDPRMLADHGAVSEEVARQMAQQVLAHSDAQVSIATTGLAGPAGDGTQTPVGTLWIAWALDGMGQAWVQAEQFELHSARGPFREAAVAHAVVGLLDRLEQVAE